MYWLKGEKEEMKQRLLEFDIAKAICIILVVMGHYAVEEPVWWKCCHDVIYTFHMPLFMFASGYIYIAVKKEENYFQFLLRKVKRLMIPYLTTSVIVITFKLLSQSSDLYVQNPVTVLSYAKMFYSPEAGYFLWFVWALWWLFCLVPFFKSRESRLALFVIVFLIHYVPHPSVSTMFCLDQALDYSLWFMLGVICFDYKVKPCLRRIPVGASMLLFMLAETLYISDVRGQITKSVLPYLGIVMIITTSEALSHRHYVGWLFGIASCSYIIYLFHTTFMGFVRAALLKMPFMNSVNSMVQVVTICIVVGSGVILPLLLYKVVRKYRVTKVLFGLK